MIGIDPAEIHPAVLEHRAFLHVRKRSHEVRKSELRKVDWLLSDMNVAPNYALDAVEDLVTQKEVPARGLLLTLKLLDWKLIEEVDAMRERVRSWGFSDVRARQLSHHRQEFALVATRKAKRG